MFSHLHGQAETSQNKPAKLIAGRSYRDLVTPYYSQRKILKLKGQAWNCKIVLINYVLELSSLHSIQKPAMHPKELL